MMGIGGIGMANVAVLLQAAGFAVSGSDQNIYEPAASILRNSRIVVKSPYAEQNLPARGPIIVGNAQSRGHAEVEAALERRLPLYSFPEFIGREILATRHSVVVAGTHGKSTTSACLAHLLSAVGAAPGYLVGAQPLNLPFGGAAGTGEHFVIEGDEYDSAFFDKRSKFLHYFPRTLILGPVEYDHADIFPDLDSLLLSFRRLINLLPRNGTLIYDATFPHTVRLAAAAPCKTISVGTEHCDFNLLPNPQSLSFRAPDGSDSFEFSIPGQHNRKNALLAIAAATSLGVSRAQLRTAVADFRGNRRRMERLYNHDSLVVYDDFAHHPTAIAAALQAVRETHPGHRIIAVVEPRSNTMVQNIFQQELPLALAHADHIIIGDIHRLERIPPEHRLDFAKIDSQLRASGKSMQHLPTAEIPDYLKTHVNGSPTAVIFMSNGAFAGVQQTFVSSLPSG